MSHNSFGHLFRITTWGGKPRRRLASSSTAARTGLPLTAEFIQTFLDKRKRASRAS